MTPGYTIALENGEASYSELAALYRRQYAEMQERLGRDGIVIGPCNPRLDQYFEAVRGGYLLNFVARCDGKPVGYFNVYLTTDMHNNEFIAQEDTLYVAPEHRTGLGKKLVQAVLADLRARGCKRFNATAVTDPRATVLWQRMGFRPMGQILTFTFKENADVLPERSEAA